MINHLNHLNHKLVPYNSKIHINYSNTYISYMCVKCNNIIFLSTTKFWRYTDGLDYDEKSIYRGWHDLENTCEEEIIKKLLE